ncbi:MAG TPA: hemin uptake protein HemP [Pirellulales bacterium]|nr:hemin uptake protein HemP [Pirellulales bacterium]
MRRRINNTCHSVTAIFPRQETFAKLLTLSLNIFIFSEGKSFPFFAAPHSIKLVNSPAAPSPAQPNDSRATDPGGPPLRTVQSQDLLQGQVEVLIAHGGETYRLRLTRSGKLILQK